MIGADGWADAASEAVFEIGKPDDDRQASNPTDQVRSTHQSLCPCGPESSDPSSVAARLNRLFDTIRPPGRGPLRNFEVLEALRARGIEFSAPYLSQLRSGRRSQPSLETLRQLADVFGVSVAYFTDVDSSYTRYVDAELYWLQMTHDPTVRRMTTALLTLPPDVREDLLQSAECQHGVGSPEQPMTDGVVGSLVDAAAAYS